LSPTPAATGWNGTSVDSGTLAREYGFTDLDGSQPDVWRYMADTEGGTEADPAAYR
jgi:hypothetical protein